MPAPSLIFVAAADSARGARKRSVPGAAVALGDAEREVRRRPGWCALAVWLTEDRRTDRRVRALLRAAGLPGVSVGLAAGSAARKRSGALGFAAHLGEVATAAEARLSLRRLIRYAVPRGARKGAARAGDRAERRLRILSEITRAANSVLDPRRVMEIVMGKAQALIRSEAWSLLLVDENEQSLSFEMTRGGRATEMKEHKVRIGQGIAGWVVQYRKPVIINEVYRDKRFDPRFDLLTGFQTRSILCAPLISRGRIIGVVELINKRRGKFEREDLETLKILVEPGAIAIENAILYKRSTELSFTDDLTHLFNGRYLGLALRREIKRGRRYQTPVAVIFLDLDGFKKINDSHGHLAGSRALVEVGEVLRSSVREIDIVCRYGGDEFTIVLPQTTSGGAQVIAERIRQNIEARVFLSEMGHEVRLTASFGVSSYPENGQSREELIQKADRAMYEIKEREKNGVALAR